MKIMIIIIVIHWLQIESPPTTPSKALDENSHELKLLSGQSVLDEASVLVDALRMAAQVWPETHQMAYDIYSRQGQSKSL